MNGPDGGTGEGRLTSWKAIAAYLGREVRTVQRWEKHEALPVHRHHHARAGTVFALRSELDDWLEGRRHAPTRGMGAVTARRLALGLLIGAAAVGLTASRPSLQSSGPLASEVASDVLRGHYLLSLGHERALRQSVESFERALARQPELATAHAGIADAYYQLGRGGRRPPPEVFPFATDHVARALALDPANAEAHAVSAGLALSWRWDFAAAETSFRRALELDPGSAPIHHEYARFLSMMGRHEEAIAHSRRAQALDPSSVVIHAASPWFYYRARREDEALAEARSALALDPTAGSALYCVVDILAREGRYAQAVGELRAAAAVAPWPEVLAVLDAGEAAGESGEQVLKRYYRWSLDRAREAEGYVSPSTFAFLYATLGEVDAAFEWLERACAQRDRAALLLNVSPGFDGLRGDPRLEDMAARVGLPAPAANPPRPRRAARATG